MDGEEKTGRCDLFTKMSECATTVSRGCCVLSQFGTWPAPQHSTARHKGISA